MIPLRAAVLAVVALAAVACGPLTSGGRADIVAAHVVDVLETGTHTPQGAAPQPFQRVRVQLDDSLYRGDVIELDWTGHPTLDENGFLHPGDHVLLSVTRAGNDRAYLIEEVVRLPALIPVAAILALALLVIARWKGLAALAGLTTSIAVLLLAVVPALQRGDDPLFAALVGSLAVIVISVIVAQGVSRTSLAAACAAMAGLGVVTAAGAFALAAARMTGLASADQILLAAATGGRIDMPRLALVAVMVGSLGAIVDLCVGQSSLVGRLAGADDALRGRRLYGSALHAGRERVTSLVNTLAFAYIGGALPLILLLAVGSQPLSISLNGEQLVEVLIAVMAAILGVVVCAPIATAIAVMFAGKAGWAPAEE